MVPVNNIPALVQIIVWHYFLKQRCPCLLTHIWVTRPQWVNGLWNDKHRNIEPYRVNIFRFQQAINNISMVKCETAVSKAPQILQSCTKPSISPLRITLITRNHICYTETTFKCDGYIFSKLCTLYWYFHDTMAVVVSRVMDKILCQSLKIESCLDTNFVITGGTACRL